MMKIEEQLSILANWKGESFFEKTNHQNLKAQTLTTFQINVGRWCNQTCKHCHVDASPIRKESMDRKTAEACIDLISKIPSVKIVDITGGAPEGNPNFVYLVEESKKLGKHIIDRCNLTILEEEGFEYLYDLFLQNEVEVIASLPHFAKSRTDGQRGQGVFEKSILTLKKLNSLGYGDKLPLNLVYNPSGLFLAPTQSQLEREYKEILLSQYDIKFNNLYCMNNIPINRFLNSLDKSGKFDEYMQLLCNSFNLSTLDGLMCRHQISVGYDGKIYDCDFNQMLELTTQSTKDINVFNYDSFLNREIVTGNHCFACTAGSGSSCGGEITNS